MKYEVNVQLFIHIDKSHSENKNRIQMHNFMLYVFGVRSLYINCLFLQLTGKHSFYILSALHKEVEMNG